MQNFTSFSDVDDLPKLLKTAENYRQNPLRDRTLGDGKTLGLFFFNASLRTRLSTQRAARNLGLEVMIMNFGSEGWQLEFTDGTVMDAGKAEHVREAAGVISQYCDLVGIRTFAGLTDREEDYAETILTAFKRHLRVPLVSLESATRHPLQSLADVLTIRRFRPVERPVVTLTWAPHPRALPQAVANSFLEWMRGWGEVKLRLACPPGLELAPEFRGDVPVFHDQAAAFEGAHFVYAKNWSSYVDYGTIATEHADWMVNAAKMSLTDHGKFMHCLPVRRNVVVADAVLDGPDSLVLEQADQRTWAAQAVLAQILSHEI